MATISLAGKEFVEVNQALSASQDDYIIAHIRLSGAMDVLVDPKRTPEKRAEDLLTALLLSGKKDSVLAGCLTETGKVWTRADAEKNAALFAAITDDHEKTLMRESIVRFVVGFFSLGERSSESSPKSSSRPAKGHRTASAGKT